MNDLPLRQQLKRWKSFDQLEQTSNSGAPQLLSCMVLPHSQWQTRASKTSSKHADFAVSSIDAKSCFEQTNSTGLHGMFLFSLQKSIAEHQNQT
jgi:P pilus assembly chaperone PapD